MPSEGKRSLKRIETIRDHASCRWCVTADLQGHACERVTRHPVVWQTIRLSGSRRSRCGFSCGSALGRGRKGFLSPLAPERDLSYRALGDYGGDRILRLFLQRQSGVSNRSLLHLLYRESPRAYAFTCAGRQAISDNRRESPATIAHRKLFYPTGYRRRSC